MVNFAGLLPGFRLDVVIVTRARLSQDTSPAGPSQFRNVNYNRFVSIYGYFDQQVESFACFESQIQLLCNFKLTKTDIVVLHHKSI